MYGVWVEFGDDGDGEVVGLVFVVYVDVGYVVYVYFVEYDWGVFL